LSAIFAQKTENPATTKPGDKGGTMEFVFVFYEWCFAVMAIILHSKVKDKGTLLLATGLTTISVLITIATTGKYFHAGNLLVSRIVPGLMLVAPIMTLSGFAILLKDWERIKQK
jgi:hypothetical protein